MTSRTQVFFQGTAAERKPHVEINGHHNGYVFLPQFPLPLPSLLPGFSCLPASHLADIVHCWFGLDLSLGLARSLPTLISASSLPMPACNALCSVSTLLIWALTKPKRRCIFPSRLRSRLTCFRYLCQLIAQRPRPVNIRLCFLYTLKARTRPKPIITLALQSSAKLAASRKLVENLDVQSKTLSPLVSATNLAEVAPKQQLPPNKYAAPLRCGRCSSLKILF